MTGLQTTLARDLFKKLEKQEEQEITASKIETSSGLEMLVETFRSMNGSITFSNGKQLFPIYDAFFSRFEKNQYSKKDVEKFTLLLPSIIYPASKQFGNMGTFLSAAINACKEDNFLLDLHSTGLEIDFLGYENIKNVTVHGNLGTETAYAMKKGTFIVNGTVKQFGNMQGGYLHIRGDANVYYAILASAGKIRIDGNYTALYADPRCKELSSTQHGQLIISVGGALSYKTIKATRCGPHETIYHQSKKVVRNGRYIGWLPSLLRGNEP